MVPHRDLQNIEPGPDDLCPCDSGKPSKLCCRTHVGWMKDPSRIEIEGGGPPLPKCYAHTLGSCGTVITRDALILITLLLDSRVVDVPRAYNRTFVMLSSLKPFFFNS